MTAGERINPTYLSPGSRVGHYEIVDQVGAGGFGCLYKVRRDGKTYALKIGRERFADLVPEDREYQEERNDREIAALKSLHHPNIVRVHSFDRWPDLEGGYPYLIMDFVEGARLYDWRASAAPSLARIATVFEKIALAVHHMHRLGIYHRDLKSANVLVRTDGEPIVVDFGIARHHTAHTLTRAASVGTITHYAPEYARYCDSAAFKRGEPFEWQPATDLHAIGYMLYEVLTGAPPFPRGGGSEAASEAAILLAIKTCTPKRPSERNPRVPEELERIVLQLLEKDPARRPQTAQELAAMLARAREEAGPEWESPFDVPDAEPLAGPPTRVATGRRGSNPDDHSDLGIGLEAGVDHASGAGVVNDDVELQSRVRSGAGARFDAPPADENAAFDDGLAHEPSEPAPPARDALPTAIREAKARLAASAPRRRGGPLVFGGVAIAATLLAIVLLGRSAPPPPASKTLLSTAESGSETRAAPVPTALPPAAGASMSPAARAEDPEPLPTTIDAAAIDASLTREYARQSAAADTAGGPATGQATAQTHLTKSASADATPWIRRSQRLEGAAPSAAPGRRPLGIPFGAHIKVKLLTNLDSRTIANGPVEAVLPSSHVVDGTVRLPARTLFYGTASDSNGRFTIRFTRLRLPDNTELAVQGIAMARDDGKPGLAADRRTRDEVERREGVATKLAKGTGNLLLDTITGGTGQEIARNAGRTVLNHEAPPPAGSEWTLQLDAGVLFDVWVEEAF
jgi:eukaryotic-like serine/threonine-protein kinase